MAKRVFYGPPLPDKGCGSTRIVFGREVVCGGHQTNDDGTIVCIGNPLDEPIQVTGAQLAEFAEENGLDVSEILAHRCEEPN